MRVALFVSCLVDQVWPSAGLATVDLLESLDCEVDFDPRQTCCGQPAFNTGYRDEARRVATHSLSVLDAQLSAGCEAIVLPTGSCTAMFGHLPALFEGNAEMSGQATRVRNHCWELTRFLTSKIDPERIESSFTGRVTYHDACHGLRELGIRDEPRALLSKVRGLELIETDSCDSCCGFGGTFSVKQADISTAMLDKKIEDYESLKLDAVVSGDVSCLMQIEGRMKRRGIKTRALHIAEILAGTSA